MRWILVATISLVGLASVATADFAATEGFSGKHGVTCGACHTPVPVDVDDPVTVTLTGLPATWHASTTYDLEVAVDGGPAANPAPGQPQAGFDLESDGGRFDVPGGMEDSLRIPDETEVTYTGPGTTLRSWRILWTAPNLTAPPAPVAFWLAGLAANGNHVMGGPDTAGERGDRFATLHVKVPPSDATVDAWRNRPIPPPTLEPLPSVVDGTQSPPLVVGRAADYVDAVEWTVDHGEWARAPGAPHFAFPLPQLEGGRHTLFVRATVDDRQSPTAAHAFAVEYPAGHSLEDPDHDPSNPWLALILIIPLAVPIVAKILLRNDA